jgi:hypothetical protein
MTSFIIASWAVADSAPKDSIIAIKANAIFIAGTPSFENGVNTFQEKPY